MEPKTFQDVLRELVAPGDWTKLTDHNHNTGYFFHDEGYIAIVNLQDMEMCQIMAITKHQPPF